jgi:hypothetical protein
MIVKRDKIFVVLSTFNYAKTSVFGGIWAYVSNNLTKEY